MPDYKTAQNDFDDQLARVTAQIAQLEKDQIDIKRRRNEVAPVSQLPPELLLKIFSYCTLALMDDEIRYIVGVDNPGSRNASKDLARLRSTYDELPYPNILRICHVCHAWREIASETPRLWAYIQAQGCTRPEIVQLMEGKAGQHALHLDYVGWPHWEFHGNQHTPQPKSFEAFRQICLSKLASIKSIAVYGNRRLAIDLLTYAPGDAENLETLILAHPSTNYDGSSYTSYFLVNFRANALLKGKTPNLRHLSVTGIIIPWTSPLLTYSPCLTRLVLRNTQAANPERVLDLLNFLRQHPSLEILDLTLPIPDTPDLLPQSDAPADICMPNLRELCINSEFPAPLFAMLHGIRVPKVPPVLKLIVKANRKGDSVVAERLFDRICQLLSEGRDAEDFIAPDNIEINSEWVRCSYVCPDGRKGAIKLSVLTSRDCESPDLTTAFQLPCSYKNLKSITIDLPSSAVPEFLWPVLARVEGLEVIKIAAENPHAFLTALRTDYGKPVEQASPKPGESPTFSFTRRSFPALRVVRFISVAEGLRWYAKQADDQAALKVSEHIQTFFKDIIDALRRRYGGVLEELAFTACAFGPKDPQATLKPLLAVARTVRWEGMILRSNGLLYHGSKLISEVPKKPAQMSTVTGRMRKLRVK